MSFTVKNLVYTQSNMANLQDDAKAYIESVLGLRACLKNVLLKVPFYLRDTYGIFELTTHLTSESALVMILLVPTQQSEYPGVVQLQKQLAQLRKATEGVIVCVYNTLTPHDRRSLITHRLNFIQPGFQMFIPEIALDIRDSFRQRRAQREVITLLPATQAMLLACIYSGKTNVTHLKTSALLGDLNYSRVTLSKAVEQLSSLLLIAPDQRDFPRKTYNFIGKPRDIFSRAKDHLRSPVRKKIGITRNRLPTTPGVFMAGETALANYTMLAEPRHRIWGMTREVFNDMLNLNAFEVSDSVDTIEEWVEIWAYPSLTAGDQIADKASLLLSLEATSDERVQIALDELKGKLFCISVNP